MGGIVVGRHINGITINPLEYLFDDEGDPMVSENKDKAKEYLRKHGFSDNDIYLVVFDEVDYDGDM